MKDARPKRTWPVFLSRNKNEETPASAHALGQVHGVAMAGAGESLSISLSIVIFVSISNHSGKKGMISPSGWESVHSLHQGRAHPHDGAWTRHDLAGRE